MNRQEVPILGALVVQAAVGFAVFITNRHRKATQSFLILSIAMICWLASLYFGSTSHDLTIVAANMRVAFAAPVLILLALNFLRLSTVKPDATWRDLLRHSGGWIILALATIIFCQSDLLVRGARFPDQLGAAPQPIYDWGVYLYAYFFTGALVVLLVASLRDLRNSSGRIRSELGYFLLGSTSILVLTLGAYQILRFFVPPSRLFWFAPLRAVLFHTAHRLRDFHAKDHGRRPFSAARDILWSSHHLPARPLRSGLVAGSSGNSLSFLFN